MTGPLSDIRILEVGVMLAGPYATMLLADLGADVIKVEGPGGDDTRTWMPPVRDDVSTYAVSTDLLEGQVIRWAGGIVPSTARYQNSN